MSQKIKHDKYYTPSNLAEQLIIKTFSIIEPEMVTEIIEPSAGNGSFSNHFGNKCIPYDIEPDHPSIIKQDFLTLEIEYKKGRLFIGNPPFGNRNSLSVKFFKKCCEYGDYIAFVQPISQLNDNLQMYEFDLIHSEDLGIIEYSDRKLHCCFNIYSRPKNNLINPKPDFRLSTITIKEYRRGRSYNIEDGYDFGMCNWGSLGKRTEFVGQFAQEVYFYCHDKRYLPQLEKIMETETIREYVKSVSMKKISVMKLYKYIKDNIEGIT